MTNLVSINKSVLGSLLFILLGLIITITNSSCKQGNKHPKETTVLDSLNLAVHKADSTLLTVDTLKIKKCTDHITMALELIKMTHKDSMSKSAADIFRSYSSVRWDLLTFTGRRNMMLLEMRNSINQLTHLSHDIKLNLITADSIPLFYGQETKKANLLIESEQLGIAKLNSTLPLYNLIAPKADSLISLIKNHKDI